MKRSAIALSIIVLLVIFSPGFSILAQPTHTPHQNPATAKSSPDLTALLFAYSNVFNLTAIRQYQDAQSMLNELEQANIPDELRYITDRYNALCRQLLATLNKVEPLLDEAATLFLRNQVSDAEQKLGDAEATIHDAQFLLDDIEIATNTLSDRLGVPTAPAGSQIRQGHDRLQGSLHQSRQLTAELNRLRQSFTERHKTRATELIPTELSLGITPASVFVGDNIAVSGRLSDGSRPLAKRKITLLLNNKPLVTTTDLDGSYQTNLIIPYEYVSTMTLNSAYIPSGDDIGTYLAGKSPPVAVNTMFHPTHLEVLAPMTAHPGLPITISGQVSSTNGNIDRTIKVVLDDIQLAEETVGGQFSLEVTPPPQTPTGEHSLTVMATPQQRYSGVAKSLTINITRLPIQTDIQVPQLVIIPKPIQVGGKVYHNLSPVQDARINLTFKDSSSTVRTATNGSFTATVKLPHLSVSTSTSANPFFVTTTPIELPLDLSLIGPQELTITVEPIEPWYAPLQIKRWIFMVNPANIGLMLVAFLSFGILIYNRLRARPAALREERGIPQPTARELPGVTPPPRPRYQLTGIKGRILSAYLDGLEAIEKITSISMAPHTTLREFLKTATPRLPTAIKPFTELTTIIEIALYSTHRLDEDIANKAKQLATTIKEELHNSGTA